jgi:hypothetical protein
MKSVVIVFCILFAAGCATQMPETASYPGERSVAADVRATKDGGVLRYLEPTPNMSAAVQWIDADFEIITPAKYAGKIVCLPISLDSPPEIRKGRVYSIWLPLSVIERRSNVCGYYFPALIRKSPNQSPEPTVMLVTPRADARVAPSTTVAHL